VVACFFFFAGPHASHFGTRRVSCAGESTAAERWACTRLFAIVLIAGVVLSSFVGIPRSLRAPLRIFVCWPDSGWSRPLFHDSAETATFEQARLDSARARKDQRPRIRALSSKCDKRIHRRHPFSTSSSLGQSDSHLQACCIYRLVNRARDCLHTHHDDGKTLAAERALDGHWLEQCDPPETEEGQLEGTKRALSTHP
jgi:hypothetical protein